MPKNRHGFTELEWNALKKRFDEIGEGYMFHLDKISKVLTDLDDRPGEHNHAGTAAHLGKRLVHLVGSGENPLPLSLPVRNYPDVTGNGLQVRLGPDIQQMQVIHLRTKKVLFEKLETPEFPDWVAEEN